MLRADVLYVLYELSYWPTVRPILTLLAVFPATSPDTYGVELDNIQLEYLVPVYKQRNFGKFFKNQNQPRYRITSTSASSTPGMFERGEFFTLYARSGYGGC